MSKKVNGAKQSLGGLKEVREIIFGEALNNVQKQIDELKLENKNLKNQLKMQENNLLESTNVIGDLKSKHETSNADQNKMTNLIQSIKKDFDKKIDELKASKIGKNQIGQAFIEWGMKVKQDDNS